MPKQVPKPFAARLLVEALSNLRPSTTGVDNAIVWISAGEFAEAAHEIGPRLMVVVGIALTADSLPGAVSVTLADPPDVLGMLPERIERQVVEFVELNRDPLLHHWNGELDARETIDALQPVRTAKAGAANQKRDPGTADLSSRGSRRRRKGPVE